MEVLSRFSLAELEISCVERPVELLRALQRPGHDTEVVCPRLNILTLDGLFVDDKTLALAKECFRFRRALGSPVHTLRLGVSPGITPESLNMLQDVVDRVEHDDINELY